MRVAIIGLALALAGTSAWAAPAPTAPPAKPILANEATILTQAELTTLIAKAPSLGQPGQANISQPVFRAAPYAINLEFRPIAGAAAAHPGEVAEVFFAVNGSGELTTGGTMVTAPAASGGNRIEGGVTRKIAKGDVIFVPGGMPHAFTSTDGSLALMSLHFPAAAATPAAP